MVIINNNNNQPGFAFPLPVSPSSPGCSSAHPAAQGAPLQGQECPVPAQAAAPQPWDSSQILARPSSKVRPQLSFRESLTLSNEILGEDDSVHLN